MSDDEYTHNPDTDLSSHVLDANFHKALTHLDETQAAFNSTMVDAILFIQRKLQLWDEHDKVTKANENNVAAIAEVKRWSQAIEDKPDYVSVRKC